MINNARRFTSTLTAMTALLPTAILAQAQLEISTFDTTDEGWSAYHDALSLEISMDRYRTRIREGGSLQASVPLPRFSATSPVLSVAFCNGISIFPTLTAPAQINLIWNSKAMD